MRPDEACRWLRQHIATGHVDTRTHEHSAREVVTYCTKHPEKRDALAESLALVIADFDWITAEQVEAAAYLVVNLESSAALQHLIDSVGERDDSTGALATQVIAAIRSSPDIDAAHDRFLPALFRWLKVAPIAHLAYETLCDLSPEDAGAYFAILAHFHHSDPVVLEKALTHLYFRGGDTVQGTADVRALVEGFATLTQAVSNHSFIPGDVRQELARTDAALRPTSIQPEPIILQNLPPKKRSSCRRAGEVLRARGSWGAPEEIAA